MEHKQRCDEAKILAEMMCRRKSNKLKIPIDEKFWNSDEWKGEYKRQITLAHGLLKLFSVNEIMAALTGELSWTYSLACKTLPEVIRKNNKKQNAINEMKSIQSTDIKFEEKAIQEVAEIKKKNKLKDLLD
jgi:hypothetical protein